MTRPPGWLSSRTAPGRRPVSFGSAGATGFYLSAAVPCPGAIVADGNGSWKEVARRVWEPLRA